MIELNKALFDERLDPELILLGGDFGGGGEDIEVAMSAGDFGGGGLGLFAADLFHFQVGEAVEVCHRLGPAAHGGVGGGFEFSFLHFEEAFFKGFDGNAQSFGDAFVGPGGVGGVFAAARAPGVRFEGGGVGDAKAIELRQPLPLARGSVTFYAFAKYFCHVIILAFSPLKGR